MDSCISANILSSSVQPFNFFTLVEEYSLGMVSFGHCQKVLIIIVIYILIIVFIIRFCNVHLKRGVGEEEEEGRAKCPKKSLFP